MAYLVKELFFTRQGEGVRTGRQAVFCRFSGCNLWSGREADRSTGCSRWCDTDFVGMNGTGGGRYSTAEALALAAKDHWQADGRPYIVCTGGEPLLQLDRQLIDALHVVGFEIAIETNGTLPVPPGVDWVCVSPKSGSKCVVDVADELKLVYPQPGQSPEDFDFVRSSHRLIQPLDDQNARENLQAAIQYCDRHPVWRLSIQMHKVWGIR